MGIGNRPATCSGCSKRLSGKSWYYRNGWFFCTKGCWTEHRGKLQQEREDARAKAKASGATEAPAAQPAAASTGTAVADPPRGAAVGTGEKAESSAPPKPTPDATPATEASGAEESSTHPSSS